MSCDMCCKIDVAWITTLLFDIAGASWVVYDHLEVMSDFWIGTST